MRAMATTSQPLHLGRYHRGPQDRAMAGLYGLADRHDCAERLRLKPQTAIKRRLALRNSSPGHAIIAPVKSRTPTCSEPSLSSVFPASHRQRIRLMSASLRAAQQLVAPSDPSAGAIIVVRGAGQIDGHILRGLAVAVYADESPPCVIAQDDDTLLVAVLVFPPPYAIRPPNCC